MLQLVIGAVMISFSAVFVKLVHVPPTVSGFYRVFFGGLILLLVMLVRRESLALKPRAFLVLSLAAFFFALDLFLWHRSILYVGPGVATLLANFQVFVLAAVGVLFLGEKLTLPQWLAIVLAMAGLALLVGADWAHLSPQYKYGVVLSLLAAVSYAGYLLALRSSRSSGTGGSPYAAITVVSLVTAAMLAATMGVEGVSFAIPAWSDGFWLLLYGLVPQVLGWVLISSSMHKVGASQVGLVLLLQPACAFIWDGVFFGRRFTAVEWTGAAITLIAIYLGTLKAVRKSS
ncbi:MAG TPA: DMT family transporter [Gammaproteobacteria bacterium]|nr:DMT family transporter [Gammaproteobacteria bacterium]